MILTFLLRRRSAIKTLGSTIDAAIARKHTCFLWLKEEAKEPFQPGDFDRWPVLKAARTDKPYGRVIGIATDKLASVGVSYWFDNILKPYVDGAALQCYLSEWHQQLHIQTRPGDAVMIEASPVVGWTMADHRALIIGGYGQRHHLLFTMKRRVPEPWRRSLQGRIWYFEKVMAAWHDAKEVGLPLVIKTRRKNGDPFWLGRFGRVVGEECMYPATSLQLMAGAQRVTHFMSGAHAEARMMDVTVANWDVRQPHLDRLPGQVQIYDALVREYTTREEYMRRFFTYDDTKAGERVMDVVEGL